MPDGNNFSCLKAVYEAGINFFDTTESYEDGKVDILLSRAIKHFWWQRQNIVISTKLFFGEGESSVNRVCLLSRTHIIEGKLHSLERLQLDYVDIVYAHRQNADTPMEEIMRGSTISLILSKCSAGVSKKGLLSGSTKQMSSPSNSVSLGQLWNSQSTTSPSARRMFDYRDVDQKLT